MKTGWYGLLFALALPAGAAEPGCIELKVSSEVRQTLADERGRPAIRLVPAEKMAEGEEVFFTVSAANTCARTLENVAIDNAVPQHTIYVADSAIAPSARVLFSVDGGFHYAPADELMITLPGEEPRVALPKDYTHIRWVMGKPLPPQAVVLARFRAVVK